MDTQRLRILAIEPDAACRGHLRALLADRIDADLVVASSAEAAAGAMHTCRPDVVLTSAVLPPRAEEQVIDALKHLDPDGTVPVITVPPLLDAPEPDAPRRVFGLLSPRRSSPRPTYDAAALVARVEEALHQAHEAKTYPRIRPVRIEPSTALILRPADATDLAMMAFPDVFDGPRESILLERKRLERAHRFAIDELPSRCTLTTPAGFIVRMLNVSATGVLFESPLKFTRDSETALSLLAPDTTHVLPARIVRSEVAGVSGVGVTYQTAARFSENVELLKKIAPRTDLATALDPPPTPTHSMADLLVRVTTELYQHQRGDAARAAFEAGLPHLIPGCEVALCDRLVRRDDAGDSIYFAVPGASGAMVQATFQPGHQPTVDEFKLLRAAAAMAAVIVHGETRSLIVHRSA